MTEPNWTREPLETNPSYLAAVKKMRFMATDAANRTADAALEIAALYEAAGDIAEAEWFAEWAGVIESSK